jgi:hypothetical protein
MRNFVVSLAVIFGCSGAYADGVKLTGGGHLSGKVRRVPDAKVPYIVVEVDTGLRVALRASQIRQVVEDKNLAEYARRAKIAGNDAELNYMLARWCKENLLLAQNRYHMQRAIEIDPDHAYARAALGYSKEQNEWVLYDELQRSRGMIKVGTGGWQLPEVAAMQAAQDEADVGAKKWIKEIGKLRTAAMRGGESGAEAIATLSAIEDPLAAGAVAKELLDSRGANSSQPRELRRLWVKLLGRFHNLPALEGLTRAGVEETDDVIREAALEELQEYGSSAAIATYVPMLKSNNNSEVNRAARALSFFPDPELALTITDALVTEHKSTQAVGGGTQAGFTPDGGGAFTSGGKTVVVTQKLNNPAALTVLKMIESEVDYGFDEVRWREHFANKRAGYQGDLRRDP